MIEFIIYLDHTATGLLRNALPRSFVSDQLFSFLSFQGFTIIVWLIIGLFTVVLEEKKHPGISKKDIRLIIIFMVSIVLANGFVYLLKFAVHRHRPVLDFILNCPRDFSFPSAHAATAFAAATVIASFDRKRRLLYFILAGLIAYSRIYLGCHYLSDISAGAVIGFAGAFLLLNKYPAAG